MPKDSNKPLLSKRELEVLGEAAKGLSNQEIADSLIISLNTVRVHMRNIFKKLDVQSRTEATMRGIQEGWIAVDAPGNTTDEEAETDAEDDASTQLVQFEPASLPTLSVKHYLYFSFAIIVGLLILSIPVVFKPLLQRPVYNPGIIETDDDQDVAQTSSNLSQSKQWQTIAQMPVPRSRMATVAYEGQLYVIGGTTEDGPTNLVQVFDPISSTWQDLASLENAMTNIQAVVLNDKIYVPGGCSEDETSTSMAVYDPETNSWTKAKALPQPLCAYAASVHNEKLFLIGGWNGQEFVNTVYAYNPHEDNWDTLSAYPLALGFAGAVSIEDKLYVVGGYDGTNEYNDVNFFDFEQNTWLAGPSLLAPRGGVGLVKVRNDVYALGGGWMESNFIDNAERLSPPYNAWTPIEAPYIGRWRNLALTNMENKIYILGGQDDDGPLQMVFAYEPIFKIFIPITH